MRPCAGTMVCSTDAALGQRVVADKSVPPRVRQALDVESGLNDDLGVPFFLVAVDLSLARLSTGVTAAVVRNMAGHPPAGAALGAYARHEHLYSPRRGRGAAGHSP